MFILSGMHPQKNYLAMVKRLEELFYSVPEEDRDALVLKDPACKFNQKKMEVPRFVNHRIETSGAELTPAERAQEKCEVFNKSAEDIALIMKDLTDAAFSRSESCASKKL